jgi:hypothetical protein
VIGLDDLEGRWRLERIIDDRRAGLAGRLEGTCIFSPDAEGLVQEEVGVLSYGDAPPMQARRRYLWRAEGDGLAVFFEDGRPFHRIASGRLSDTHLCPPDTYEVAYLFDDWPAFSTTWCVSGPRKDLLIRSRYSPA